MKKSKKGDDSLWQKTHYANLVRYKPSKAYFARIRIDGKLIRRTLKTNVLTVAKLRLADLEGEERKKAEHQVEVTDGKMTFGDAVTTYRLRLTGDVSVKPRTRDYHEQRIKALLGSWPELKKTEIRNVTKSECLNWAANFAEKRSATESTEKRSATAFNHTVGIFKRIFEIGVEAGVRYDNPVRFIKHLQQSGWCESGGQVVSSISGSSGLQPAPREFLDLGLGLGKPNSGIFLPVEFNGRNLRSRVSSQPLDLRG